MNLTCQHCHRDLSEELSSYRNRSARSRARAKELVAGTLAGQLGGHRVDFCNSLCRDQWDRLEGISQRLTNHRWEIKPAQVFEPGDAAEAKCSCGFSFLAGDIEVARATSAHLHAAAAELEREFRRRQLAENPLKRSTSFMD